MSLFGSLMTNLSGLDVHAEKLNVIGQNLSNMNTVGYKDRSATFATVLGEATRAQGAASQVQLKTRINTETTGTIKTTGNAFDMAIVGRGFYVMNEESDASGETYYSRDGSFQPDSQGYLRNKSGMYVQGYAVTRDTAEETTTGALVNLRIDPEKNYVDGATTTTANARLNLPAENREDVTTTIPIYDINSSTPNALQMNWSPVSGENNQWSLSFSVPSSEGTMDTTAAVTVTFDEDGDVTSPQTTSATVTWSPYTDTLTGETVNRGTQTYTIDLSGSKIGGSSFSVFGVQQDGIPLGTIDNVTFDEDGVLYLSSNSGAREPTHKLAMAMFNAPDQLVEHTSNVYFAETSAGLSALTVAGNDGAGDFIIKSVEMSNSDPVDLFSQMIKAQRAYSFTSSALRAADEMISIASGMK